MDEAFRRLRSGDFSDMEVGYDLGYQNLSKFSKMFKKVKGISPCEVIKLSTAKARLRKNRKPFNFEARPILNNKNHILSKKSSSDTI